MSKTSRKLEKRALKRFARKLSPEKRNYAQWHYRQFDYVYITKQKSDNFSPTNKLKDNTVIGPLDGKGSWKTDHYPSVINTTTGRFCPATVADKEQITKEKVAKERKYEDKVRREKYTTGESIDLKYEPYSFFESQICMKIPRTFTKKIKHIEKEEEQTFEEKLCDTISTLDIKSTSDCSTILTALQAALCRRLTPDIVRNNYTFITEALEKTLRKGRRAEQIAAAKAIPILFVQLDEDLCEKLIQIVRTPLLDNIRDETINTSVRAECCQSLAIISFLSNSAKGDLMQLMKIYEKIFCGKYQEDDNSVKVEHMLHVTALDAWSLLLTKCSPAEVYSLLNKTTNTSTLSLSNLAQLLRAPSTELQMSAGVALSLVYEMGLEFSEKFGQNELTAITTDLKQLLRGPCRFKYKTVRKRAVFRDVLKFFEDGVTPVAKVYVDAERIELDQWSLHVRYHRLAAALGSGLQVSFGTSFLQCALLIEPPRRQNLRNKNHIEEAEQDTSENKSKNVSRVKKFHPSASDIKARNILRAKARNKDAIYY